MKSARFRNATLSIVSELCDSCSKTSVKEYDGIGRESVKKKKNTDGKQVPRKVPSPPLDYGLAWGNGLSTRVKKKGDRDGDVRKH